MENDKKIGKVRLTISEGYLIMVVTGIGQMFDEQKFIGEQERSIEGGGPAYGWSASDPGGSGFGKDQGADSPYRISDR